MSQAPHSQEIKDLLQELHSQPAGLTADDAQVRLARYGRNALPHASRIHLWKIFLRQFLDPLIYVLLFAAGLSLLIGKITDALFIFGVLILNAIIGTVQEYSAQRSTISLDMLVTSLARVLRRGEAYEVNAEELVPGDIVLLESGDKVPADLRLIQGYELEVDESLLTGESLPVNKQADKTVDEDASIADRLNMLFSGTLVIKGRATGLVVSTGTATELGKIASDVLQRVKVKPPLLVRMERFTLRMTVAMSVIILLIAIIVLIKGMAWLDVFMLAAALAVAAIPEGLPVALTIALAISIRRMAKRNVIARRLAAVEALGSCTFIATDKTGTLTRNQISVERVVFPLEEGFKLPFSELILDSEKQEEFQQQLPVSYLPGIKRLALAMMLTNEGFLGLRNGSWIHHGDSMDVALLVFAHNLGMSRHDTLVSYPLQSMIPFESLRRYSASLHAHGNKQIVFVKGAVETLLEMSTLMDVPGGEREIDRQAILKQAHELAEQGYRVLAAASAVVSVEGPLQEPDLHSLTFLGLTGMIDPLREESSQAVKACHAAGIHVAMLTGDHPTTAYAIAAQLGLADSPEQIVTGKELKQQVSEATLPGSMLVEKRVYARLEPHQKLDIVTALQRSGHFVAMTGDGANDAPALRAAHVGVAMGKSGTAVARETADIILADDNFASIVAGVEEGRIAYNNVRKVIHLLISTGAAEIVLFFLSLLFGLPIPLTAVQLLWLNLVTNGIQHVALAFEPGEGDELRKPPRRPEEAIFNRVMIERVVMAAVTIGLLAFCMFYYLLNTGMTEEQARNGTLLLMVLFENIHVFNSRSETQSVFLHNPLRNLFVLLSVVGAQIIHIGAMYMPGLAQILQIQPVSLYQWFAYLGVALLLLLVSELYKQLRH